MAPFPNQFRNLHTFTQSAPGIRGDPFEFLSEGWQEGFLAPSVELARIETLQMFRQARWLRKISDIDITVPTWSELLDVRRTEIYGYGAAH
jgi:hypothetical protein